jgi:hypothetical protein
MTVLRDRGRPVASSGDRILILLGAGASVEAGVPVTTAMTEKVVNVINEQPEFQFGQVGRALTYVTGAIMVTTLGSATHRSEASTSSGFSAQLSFWLIGRHWR